MSRRNNSERGDPPHTHRWTSERDRLQQEKNKEYGRPVAIGFLLLSLRCVPDIKQHWRKERRPDGQNSAQTIDNGQSDKPVFSKHDVFPHVCWAQYLNKIVHNYLYRESGGPWWACCGTWCAFSKLQSVFLLLKGRLTKWMSVFWS